MRSYSKFEPAFWSGPVGRKLRTLDVQTRLVACYLLTAPSSNMIGLYYLPPATLAYETGLSIDEVLLALQALDRIEFCSWAAEDDLVWVRDMARCQLGDELRERDKRIPAIEKLLAQHRDSPLAARFMAAYGAAFKLRPFTSESPSKGPSGRRADAPDDEDATVIDRKPHHSPSEGASKGHIKGPPKALRSQEQEQEKDQEKEDPPPPPADAGGAGGGGAVSSAVPGMTRIRRQHPLDAPQGATPPDDGARLRASVYLERFAELYQAHLGIPYVANPGRDFEPAVRLVTAFSDADLDALTVAYLSRPTSYDDNRPRTPGRLTYLTPQLLARRARAMPSPSSGRPAVAICRHDPPCGKRSDCVSAYAKALLAGDPAAVPELMRAEVETYAARLREAEKELERRGVPRPSRVPLPAPNAIEEPAHVVA